MKYLVTGGAGFIGSSVVRRLAKPENEVLVIDSLTYASNIDSIIDLKKENKIIFENEDICNRPSLIKIFNKFKPEKVIHLAAETHVDNSIEDPDKFLKTNVLGTFELLKASTEYLQKFDKMEKKNFSFHHVSTDEVYGDLPHPDDISFDQSDPSLKFTENSNYKPSSPYSASKAASDHLVRAWHRTYNLPITISNCSNNYGPFQHKEKLIPTVIINALNRNNIPVYGDGKQIRDWLFVEDHTDAIIKILSFGKIGSTYNIGGRCEIKNIDLIKIICNLLDSKLKTKIFKHSSLIKYVDDRKGHDRRYAIDPYKIENELSWKAKETIQSGLDKTIEFYLQNYTF